MLIYQGSTDQLLSEDKVHALVTQAFSTWDCSGQRVLVIIPDGTRSMPVPLFFRLFYEALAGRAAKLDYLVALGTHPRMSEEALCRLVGISREDRTGRYAKIGIFNHHWEQAETFATLGTITAEETSTLSQGMLSLEVPVRINRMVLDYDLVIVCGPVFPHEVAGFSGGEKYFFPGISGPEVINFTHWLGALITSSAVIGNADTPIRAVIHRAASFIPTPKLFFCSVVKGDGLTGLAIGDSTEAWSKAAELSAKVHVRYLSQPYPQVLAQMPRMYDDLWTGGKGMYKLEPVVADGGEVIIYAPHITEISYTHGNILDEIGYHVRDYFVKQWDRFQHYPWGVLAHSTHVRGLGSYLNGIEQARIQVTLATSIPPERCHKVNLGYTDPAKIDLQSFQGREDEGILFVPHAGEILYRLDKIKSSSARST
jgi:nickel-dependent lactate racemase